MRGSRRLFHNGRVRILYRTAEKKAMDAANCQSVVIHCKYKCNYICYYGEVLRVPHFNTNYLLMKMDTQTWYKKCDASHSILWGFSLCEWFICASKCCVKWKHCAAVWCWLFTCLDCKVSSVNCSYSMISFLLHKMFCVIFYRNSTQDFCDVLMASSPWMCVILVILSPRRYSCVRAVGNYVSCNS